MSDWNLSSRSFRNIFLCFVNNGDLISGSLICDVSGGVVVSVVVSLVVVGGVGHGVLVVVLVCHLGLGRTEVLLLAFLVQRFDSDLKFWKGSI